MFFVFFFRSFLSLSAATSIVIERKEMLVVFLYDNHNYPPKNFVVQFRKFLSRFRKLTDICCSRYCTDGLEKERQSSIFIFVMLRTPLNYVYSDAFQFYSTYGDDHQWTKDKLQTISL